MGWSIFPRNTRTLGWDGLYRCVLCRAYLKGGDSYYLIEHDPVDGVNPFQVLENGRHVVFAHAPCLWKEHEESTTT